MPYRLPNETPRPCTCPEDSRPRPCQQMYALTDCIEHQKSLRPIDYTFPHEDVTERHEPSEEFSERARILRLQYENDRRIYRDANPHRERAD